MLKDGRWERTEYRRQVEKSVFQGRVSLNAMEGHPDAELLRQLNAVRAMGDGNDTTRATAVARLALIEALGAQRWKHTVREAYVEIQCRACGYSFGDESNLYDETSAAGREILEMRATQQTIHDEICRSGLYIH